MWTEIKVLEMTSLDLEWPSLVTVMKRNMALKGFVAGAAVMINDD